LLPEVVKSGSSLFRRGGLQDLVKHLVHLVSVARRRLVQDVPPEVYTEEFLGMTPLPDKSREGLLQSLLEALMGITVSQLNA
jgi:hypothetical protein